MKDLVDAILADGKVDADEVKQLRDAIFADGKVDAEEVVVLGKINESATEKCEEFTTLFVDAFKAFALEDDATPGVVDGEEAQVILDVVNGDGVVDDVEKAMIIAVCSEATSVESEELVALYDSIKE